MKRLAAVHDHPAAFGYEWLDIRTTVLKVTPKFNSYHNIIGFEVINGVTVTLRDLSDASRTIGAAFEAGANDVRGPARGTVDPQQGSAEARVNALKDALSKAEACASGLGMRINRVLTVNEGTLSDAHENVQRRFAGGSSGPPIEEGGLLRSLSISISCALVAK